MSLTTSVMQEYLAEIYRIASYQEDPYVSTSKLAERMQKTAAAIVRMASRLKEAHLIEHEPYEGIKLTLLGEQEALQNIRRHRLLEVFLVEIMKLEWHEVHEECDKLAGVVSDKLMDKIEGMLGIKTRCPHGEPIPRADGVMPLTRDVNLTDLEPSQELMISRVHTHDPNKLIYLKEINLIPGQKIEFVARAPFNGPLRLKIGRDEQVIGMELAHALRVCKPSEFSLQYPD